MPVKVEGRRVRNEADAVELLSAVSGSRLPLATWCGANGVNACSLYWWRAKLHARDVAQPSRSVRFPRLVEVQVPAAVAAPAARTAASDRYEVVLPNDLVVRVGADFDAGVLRRLVEAVRPC
jgi:hypothetical protein